MKFREVSRLTEFRKDMKKLSKRFKSLGDDLDTFIDTELNLYHKLDTDNRGIFQIPALKTTSTKVFKAKKFACLSLKGKGVHSGIRVIYTYVKEKDRIELIEIYFKGDKEKEDRDRILRHYGG